MRWRAFLIPMLLATAALAQDSQGGAVAPVTAEMVTPPPVSGMTYATKIGSEERHNYLRGGVSYTTSYIDNYFAGYSSTSIAETTLSVLPTIALDAASTRQHMELIYSPGFTFYRPSSTLNEMDNTAAVNYDFRLAEHATVRVMEQFRDSSAPFSPADAESGSVSGAPVYTTPGVTPPFAKRLTNDVIAEITMQTGLNEMIGASGISTVLHYPSSSQTPGLSDSNSRGGTVFYNHRISPSQYAGVTYQFMDMLTTPAGAESTTQTSTAMGFYTIYLTPGLSLSLSGGPQYYKVTEAPLPAASAWGPSAAASMGWQSGHVSFAASYSQSVTGAGGLPGAYRSRNASANVRWQLARTWTAGADGAYSINKSVDAMLKTESENGHSVRGSVTLEHPIGRQVGLVFNYFRVHQKYDEVAAIAANPDSDRFSVSITWNFLRPLGK